MVCCKVCRGQLVARSVTWCQRCAEVQTSLSDAIRSVEECSQRFLHRPKTENLQTVGEIYLKCSASLLEVSRSIVNSLRSCIKNRLNESIWCLSLFHTSCSDSVPLPWIKSLGLVCSHQGYVPLVLGPAARVMFHVAGLFIKHACSRRETWLKLLLKQVDVIALLLLGCSFIGGVSCRSFLFLFCKFWIFYFLCF